MTELAVYLALFAIALVVVGFMFCMAAQGVRDSRKARRDRRRRGGMVQVTFRYENDNDQWLENWWANADDQWRQEIQQALDDLEAERDRLDLLEERL